MIVRELLPPVGHGEVGVDPLSSLELILRLFPSEAVKDCHTPKEVLLRFARGGGREIDRSDVIELRGKGVKPMSRGSPRSRGSSD